MPENKVTIVFKVDGSGAVRGFEQIDAASGRTSRKISEDNATSGKSFGKVSEGHGHALGSFGLLAAGGATAMAGLAVAGVISAAKTSIAWQGGMSQLKVALTNTGQYSNAIFKAMGAQAEALSTKGGFSPAENVQALTQLERATGNHAKALRDMALATDIARGANKNHLVVAKAITMVEQGKTTGLSRLGIVLRKGSTPAQAIAELQAKFGGGAAAFSSTAAGSMSNLKNSFDIIKQTIGEAFLPVIQTLAKTLSGLMPQIQAVLKAVAGPLASILQQVIPPLAKAILQIMPIVGAAMKVLLPPLIAVFKQVVPPLIAILRAVVPPLVSIFAKVIAALAPVMGNLIKTLVPAFTKLWQTLTPVIVQMINILAPVIAKLIATLAPAMAKLVIALAPVIGALAKAFLTLAKPLTDALIKLLPLITAIANLVNAIPFTNSVALPKGLNAIQQHALGQDLKRIGVNPTAALAAPSHVGKNFLRKTAVQNIGAQRNNSINQAGSAAGMGSGDGFGVIQLNHKTMLGNRVIAENTTHYALKRNALSGAFAS